MHHENLISAERNAVCPHSPLTRHLQYQSDGPRRRAGLNPDSGRPTNMGKLSRRQIQLPRKTAFFLAFQFTVALSPYRSGGYRHLVEVAVMGCRQKAGVENLAHHAKPAIRVNFPGEVSDPSRKVGLLNFSFCCQPSPKGFRRSAYGNSSARYQPGTTPGSSRSLQG